MHATLIITCAGSWALDGSGTGSGKRWGCPVVRVIPEHSRQVRRCEPIHILKGEKKPSFNSCWYPSSVHPGSILLPPSFFRSFSLHSAGENRPAAKISRCIAETTEDYNSPTTSSFTTRLHNCRNTVTLLEEVGQGRCPPRAALRGPRRARRDASLPPLAAAASPLDCVDFRAGEEGDVWGLGEPHPPAGPPPAHPAAR